MNDIKSQEKPRYWARAWVYIVGFVCALALFCVAAYALKFGVGDETEAKVLRAINDLPDFLRMTSIVLGMLGSVWAAIVCVGAASVLRKWNIALRMALSVLVAYGLAYGLQQLVTRPLPPDNVADVTVRVAATGFAFPSLPVAIATVLACTLLAYVPRAFGWLIALLWIGAVAVAQMYAGLAAPLDVCAGFALGLGIVCFWQILPFAVRRKLRLG